MSKRREGGESYEFKRTPSADPPGGYRGLGKLGLLERRRNSQGLNILCLDGGGVRGLSELILIDETMKRYGRLDNNTNAFHEPFHCFDVIAGSGTGGVIACMIGRLRMPIEGAITEYGKLVREGFSKRKPVGSMGGAYVGSNLKNALKAMVKKVTGNADEKMLGDYGGCKTMVFAMSKHNMNAGIPVIFRSYRALDNPGPDCTIWEALYATMAHPDLFDSIEIGDHPLQQSFIGGEIGNSNPIPHVLSEVRSIYLGRYVSCVLSVGAGHPATIGIDDSRISRVFRTKELAAMRGMAIDSERMAEFMAKRFEDVRGVYFRLSVDHGMQNVGADDWEKLSSVAAHTHAYLGKTNVRRCVDLIVRAVKDRKETVAVAWIDGRIQTSIDRPIALKHCPAPTPVFTGRGSEAEKVRLCIAGNINERRVCVIYGLGGTGKSQLAFKVVEENRDHWTHVIYVDARTRGDIEETLQNYALVRGVGRSHTSALDWLGCLRGRWLLILDNADHSSLSIKDYFPPGNRGSILITTCLSDLVMYARGPSSTVPVSSMSTDQAFALLAKVVGLRGQTLSPNDIFAALNLLEDFGYLALAIVHAGAYISHHPHMTVSGYHTLFLNGRRRMLEEYSRLPVKLDDYEKTVYTTWMLCYDLLEQPASRRLLWLMSFLYHKGIPIEVFRRSAPSVRTYTPVVPLSGFEQAADDYIKEYLGQFQNGDGHWDSGMFSDTISKLASYSLVEFDQTNSAYNVHILVQDWVRVVVIGQIEPSSLDWLECTTTLLSRSVSCGDVNDVQSLDFKRALGPHVSKILLEHNGIVGVNHAMYFAQIFKARGQWDEEERLRVQIKEALAAHVEHHIALQNLDDLVTVYRNRGKWAEAESLCIYVWEARERASSKYHIETVTSAVGLIEILQKRGRIDQAQGLHQELIQQHQMWLIYLFPVTLLDSIPDLELSRRCALVSRLLQVSQNLGHSSLALMMSTCDSILEELKRAAVVYQDRPSLLELIRNFAVLGELDGRFDLAQDRYEELLCAQELVLGNGHKATLRTMQNLADAYLALGKWEEANEMQRRFFDICQRTFEERDRRILMMEAAPRIMFTFILLHEWRLAFSPFAWDVNINLHEKDGAWAVYSITPIAPGAPVYK